MPGVSLTERPLSEREFANQLEQFRKHWTVQQNADRWLQVLVCLTLLGFATAQLVFIWVTTNQILGTAASGKDLPDSQFFEFVIIGVFAEITTLLAIVVRSLFTAPANTLTRHNAIIATLIGAERPPE